MIPCRHSAAFRFFVTVAVIALPHSGTAKVLRVLSGDHDDFTRLVVLNPKETDWRLGRTAAGYQLQLDVPQVQFDTKGVFELISRRRLASVKEGANAGTLDLRLAPDCNCYASAFVLTSGEIVIDVTDGEPPQDSPFEQPLGEDAPQSSGNKPTAQARPAAPLLHPGQQGPANARVALAATISFRPKPNDEASLPIYWRNVLPAQSIQQPLAEVTDTPAAAAEPKPNEEQAHAQQAEPIPDPPANGSHAAAAATDLDIQRASPQLPVHALPVLPTPAQTGHDLSLPPSVSSENADIEEDLLRQLSRAASQGLVRIDPPKVREIPTAPQEPTVESAASTPPVAADTSNHILFHAETSVDRDGRDNPIIRHMNDSGNLCPSNRQLALEKWGGKADGSAAQWLTEAHVRLIGEFDRPDPKKVEDLAHLYLHLGLGAEARQAMAAFGTTPRDAALLTDVARILDDEPIAEESSLHQMLECETAAALWAFLAAPDPAAASSVNLPAVLRGFSALPAQLRDLLGRRLSDRLIMIGAKDAAKNVRNAMSRKSKGRDRNLKMLDAELALSDGHDASAAKALDRLSKGNDALSHDALRLSVEARLRAGELVDPKQADSIAALAYESKDSPQGAELAYLEVAARAASGNFAESFAALDRWATDAPGFARGEMAQTAFGLLVARADDSTFLAQYFAHRNRLAEAAEESGLTLEIAGRLADLGFADEVDALLSDAADQSETGQMLIARAAIGRFDPETALAILEGVDGQEAAKLRANAYRQLGDEKSAAIALNAAGDLESAAQAAWSAGEWQAAAAGNETFKAAVETFGLTHNESDAEPGADADADAPASLSGSRAILDESAKLREMLATLLPPEPSAEGALPAATGAAPDSSKAP